ncbi:MAG TPA: polysaccharide biosynthesis/export family protein [Candidatus Binataceae bacterium]|nr:polysaccharide biosynthesis/export family protein [Candidatus Binataceae bacterium]
MKSGDFSGILARIVAGCLMVGCASSTMRTTPGSSTLADPPAASAETSSANTADPRLAALWARRTSAAGSGHEDYPIGPGDVLTVSVPEIDEIKDRKVRVSTQGTIELPLIGVVSAGGLSEDGLARELDLKLQKYMFNPQATVFVDEYRNREAAVVGAVNKPGLLVLTSPAETILDVLTQAGGVAPTAADELVLIPGDERSAANPQLPGGGANEQDAVGTLAMANSAHAVSIGLRSGSLSGSGKYLSLPVRPGDVIVVPGGGQVMVVGWVHNPGHFEVGSGLTVLGAIGEAGGPMYAAATKEIALIRSEKDGAKSTVAVNLDKIAHGEQPDIPVKANDVIDVPYSDLRIGPYIFYSVVERIGLMAPAIPY